MVSHPFGPDAGDGFVYEVLTLGPTGTISPTGVTFVMGNGQQGRIAFTPDGRIGLVAQNDGSLGAFRLEDDGGVTVLPSPDGGPYLSAVMMNADGSRAIGIDPDTLSNGGGLYDLEIGCDDRLAWRGALGVFNTPDALAFLPTDATEAIVAGGAGFRPDGGLDTELIAPLADGGPTLIGAAQAYPAGDAIPSAVAVTVDGRFAFVADNGIFVGNRVAVVALSSGALSPLGILTTDNPADIVASPFDDTLLVLNSDGLDNLTPIVPAPDAGGIGFVVAPHLAYVGAPPQLPTEAVVIQRGSLVGRVLIGENLGVRQVQFESDGGIVDLGLFTEGGDYTNIVGALGVQP